MSSEGASYRAAGVDYDALDAGKRLAMAKALSTSSLLAARGGRALDASRGEPAFVFELGEQTFAFVVEGLGTKSIIARAGARRPGGQPLRRGRLRHCRGDPQRPLLRRARCRWSSTRTSPRAPRSGTCSRSAPRRCWRAGARHAWTQAACGVGASRRRYRECSPSGDIELAGAAVGAVPDGRSARSSVSGWAPGDEIVLVASSGLHANGASLARLIAGRLPDGYATKLRWHDASGRRCSSRQ